jgi:fructose/tagatose bisphosphate aldolase
MPLITDADEARSIYRETQHHRVVMPAFGTENRDTTEAAFRAVSEIAQEYGIAAPPLVIACTAHYEGRTQMLNYTSLHTTADGLIALRDDVERLCRPDGPYHSIRAMVHLDHAQPEADSVVIAAGLDFLASVMYDCSAFPFPVNIALTKRFVEETRGRVMIEGAVDEIYASGSGAVKNDLTTPEQAKRFMDETGCDLIVANLGTEHRATARAARYHGNRAREISAAVGPVLVLHGTSSLGDTGLSVLRGDGIVRVNIWTRLEQVAAAALAHDVIENLGGILPAEELQALADRDVLNPEFARAQSQREPGLDCIANVHRRDEVCVPAMVALMKRYLLDLGYADLGPSGQQ